MFFFLWEEEPEIATRCTVWVFRCSIPIRVKFLYFSAKRLRSPPSLPVQWVPAFLLGGKAAAAEVNPPTPPISAERKNESSCTFTSLRAVLT